MSYNLNAQIVGHLPREISGVNKSLFTRFDSQHVKSVFKFMITVLILLILVETMYFCWYPLTADKNPDVFSVMAMMWCSNTVFHLKMSQLDWNVMDMSVMIRTFENLNVLCCFNLRSFLKKSSSIQKSRLVASKTWLMAKKLFPVHLDLRKLIMKSLNEK